MVRESISPLMVKAAIFLILCLLGCAAAPASAVLSPLMNKGGQDPGYIPGELLIRFSTDKSLSQEGLDATAVGIMQNYGLMAVRDYRDLGLPGLVLVRVPPGSDLDTVQGSIAQEASVLYTSKNFIRTIARVPNDPLFPELWGLKNTGQHGGKENSDIHATSAWDTTIGSQSVIVAVVDTGVDYNHPDLEANMWTDPETGSHGYDFVNNDIDPMDDEGHGSHCAGTIAAVGNNARGITGVSWNARIMALKVFDEKGSGEDADAIAAILWASRHGAKVISNSWSDSDFNPALKEAIEASGALNVCAAGNGEGWFIPEPKDTDIKPEYPAAFDSPTIISVAAVNNTDRLAWFSNYGAKTVDLAAPGVNILSCGIDPMVPIPSPTFIENFSSFDRWEIEGDRWNLDPTQYVSAPSSALCGPFTPDDPMFLVFNLTSKKSVDLAGLTDPWMGCYVQDDYRGEQLAVGFFNLSLSTDRMNWTSVVSSPEQYYPTFSWISANIPPEFKGKKVYVRIEAHWGFVINRPSSPGIWIDDLMIGEPGPATERYIYEMGTSMATPHVSGAAALVWSVHPDYSSAQVKEGVLMSVTKIPALAGKCVTNGRLNVEQALGVTVPFITGVDPASAYRGEVVPLVTIFGKNFEGGEIVTFSLNATCINTTGVLSDQNLLVRDLDLTGAEPGFYTVIVTRVATGLSGNLKAAFLVKTRPPVTNGSISISSSPEEAYIYLDGIATGKKTNITVDNVCPGDHMMRLTRTGYRDYNAAVTVQPGQTSFVTATLEPVGPEQIRANFTSDIREGVSPLVVSFSDLSTGGPASWYWTFGDGSASREKDPSHTYTKPGVYSVSLKVSNSSLTSSYRKTISRMITVR